MAVPFDVLTLKVPHPHLDPPLEGEDENQERRGGEFFTFPFKGKAGMGMGLRAPYCSIFTA
jgi:hypothetical protein